MELPRVWVLRGGDNGAEFTRRAAVRTLGIHATR